MVNTIELIAEAIVEEFSPLGAEAYMQRWHEGERYEDENFEMRYFNNRFDLSKTLHGISDDELLLAIAVDIEVDVPGLIYSIPEIKGILSTNYKGAASILQNALVNMHKEPAAAVTSANSALESIVKHICENASIKDCKPNATLHELVQHILKEFNFYPSSKMKEEVRDIGSGLLTAAEGVRKMRNRHTNAHGKFSDDYIIDDPLYAYYIVNAVATIGFFLINFYEKKYLPQQQAEEISEDDIPF